MKTNLGTGYIIEGFDSVAGEYNEKLGKYSYLDKDKIVVYYGKTSEITEEVAKKCVQYSKPHYNSYLNYTQIRGKNNTSYSKDEKMWFKTAKESIQSACNQPYCIIYKKK
jgi:hypothetical protein